MPLYQRHVSVRAVRSFSVGRSRQSRAGLLSWGSSKIAPPPIKALCVHSQAAEAALRREDTNLRACSALAVPPGSDGLLRTGLAGLLHPATGHGVRHISGSLLRPHPKMLPPLRAFPNGAYTLRSFSLRDSRSVSPRPLPSRCYVRFPLTCRPCKHGFSARFGRTLSLKALLHREIRCFARCCHRTLLDAPLGLLHRR